MSKIKEFFQSLVKAGTIPQEPMDYDATTLKIYIDHLEAENAALRERLEKAVELPCKVGDKLFYVNEYYKIPKIEEHTVTAFTLLSECTQIHVESGGYFLTDTKNVCFDRAEAEARLAELKGEK